MYSSITRIAHCLLLGLKQALATVNDYNPLMKDFPLEDLLSATELNRIQNALNGIFTHLRKIRSTHYPIQRVLRLIEAISRDLSTQLLKVRSVSSYVYEHLRKVQKMFVSDKDEPNIAKCSTVHSTHNFTFDFAEDS